MVDISRFYKELSLSQLQDLCGVQHSNLYHLETLYDVTIYSKGEGFLIKGDNATKSASMLDALVNLILQGKEIDIDTIDRLYNFNVENNPTKKPIKSNTKFLDSGIKTKRKSVVAKNQTQLDYLNSISKSDIVFATGVAGTGKTYLAVAKAIEYLLSGKYSKVILSRPAVEAGESLGFLPGSLQEKVNPYLRPLYDALEDMLPYEFVSNAVAKGQIEVAPIAFMRGRTLNNAFVILDEAQNATLAQLKMFLTRLGENSKMVITGDTTQIDLPRNQESGLVSAINILKPVEDISFIHFCDSEVVRSKIVSEIVKCFDKFENKQ